MSAAQIMGLVASGQATSRAELSRVLGWAPSTVSAHVQELLDSGLLEESGEGSSRGGRRPRLLSVRDGDGVILGADLGGHHGRVAVLDGTGRPQRIEDIDLDIAAGPAPVLERVAEALGELCAGRPVRGIGVGLPGPVGLTGVVVGPSRMPGWSGFSVRDWLAARFGAPLVVENDANLMAMGEAVARGRELRDFVFIKAGTGVGAAVVTDGRLHRGARGVAGDISHLRVPAGGDQPCSCGNFGCLETIASGAALVAAVRRDGVAVRNTADLVRLAHDGNPTVTTNLRFAGRQLGEVLATVVNFFNPQAVILGGALSGCDLFVAAARGVLYERCLPLTTQELEIGESTAGPDAGLLGIGRLVIDQGMPAPAS
ncbi:transcriptional regulator [Microtetraspora sp. NBRC 13810]|uniref:ROK family transcriptional regulator n=1 Tax=Microtetraspora sp. NBRC 13810 TaxID=3030990 RepID=UPI0024A11AF0|nr:ROK family transcriptional regulator [Microtetraspora sp. NBRC 13810]GLW10455.1 transcriptional regulator [Microtetraspora sp. NBRC 13810]